MINMTFVIIFLIAFVVFVGFSLLAMRQLEKAQNQRTLSVIRGQAIVDNASKSDKNSQNKRREEIARRLKQGQDKDAEKKKASIDMRLKQAGLSMTPKRFWLYSFLFMFVAVGLAILAKMSPFVIVMIAITALLGVPRYVLRWKIRRRQKKFLGDFVEESFPADEDGNMKAEEGWTQKYIYPGYHFKLVDGMITNFHLPKSTLIMLVSAMGGRENVLNAYQTAIKERYRFYSFGDAMLII